MKLMLLIFAFISLPVLAEGDDLCTLRSATNLKTSFIILRPGQAFHVKGEDSCNFVCETTGNPAPESNTSKEILLSNNQCAVAANFNMAYTNRGVFKDPQCRQPRKDGAGLMAISVLCTNRDVVIYEVEF